MAAPAGSAAPATAISGRASHAPAAEVERRRAIFGRNTFTEHSLEQWLICFGGAGVSIVVHEIRKRLSGAAAGPGARRLSPVSRGVRQGSRGGSSPK
jgi:hypothetical protein